MAETHLQTRHLHIETMFKTVDVISSNERYDFLSASQRKTYLQFTILTMNIKKIKIIYEHLCLSHSTSASCVYFMCFKAG